jgi:hypothetical protein
MKPTWFRRVRVPNGEGYVQALLRSSFCMLSSANIFSRRRFSSWMDFISVTIDAPIPPNFQGQRQNVAVLIPCSRHRSGIGTPPSAWRRIAMIWASANLLFFIRTFSLTLPRKLYFRSPSNDGGITAGSKFSGRAFKQ